MKCGLNMLGFWRLMKSIQRRFYYGVCGKIGNDVRHAKQPDDATAFARREEEPFAIGARDERRRRHSGAPTLRRYAATSLLPQNFLPPSMAYLRGQFRPATHLPAHVAHVITTESVMTRHTQRDRAESPTDAAVRPQPQPFSGSIPTATPAPPLRVQACDGWWAPDPRKHAAIN